MKQRILKTLMLIAVLLTNSLAFAHDFQYGPLYYNILSEADSTVEVTYEGSSFYSQAYTGTVVIPEKITYYNGVTYSVTSIGNNAFTGCYDLIEITLPSSIPTIGHWTFAYCYGLTSITIPNSVTSIGEHAFDCCTGLTSITIPNGVTSIGEHAFLGSGGLRSIIVEEGNTVYNSLNNSNAIIETATNTLIKGCNATVIPESVTSIGSAAFNGCSGLTEITIPQSVTSIGATAFANCTGLTSLTIPSSVTSIGGNAFYSCTSLTEIHVEAVNPPTIKESTFEKVDKSIPVYLPAKSVESYKQAQYWSEFTNIQAVVNVGDRFAVDGIYYEITNIENSEVAVRFAAELNENVVIVVIPETVVYQGVTYNVTSISKSAFEDCYNLTSVRIGNNVTSIGDSAFAYCEDLYYVIIPNSVTSIGEYAFYCTDLYSVTIPNSVTSIGRYAFSGDELTEVNFNAENCTRMGYVFNSCNNLTTVNIGDEVKTIPDNAFAYCHHLTSITIPNSLTSIGYNAFYDCPGLESIIVESGNAVYDSRNNCNAIIESTTNKLILGCKNSTIPNSVTSIGSSAFSNCTGLTSFVIPEGVTSIEEYAFWRCSDLTSVTISESVTGIGNSAFHHCSSLTSITSLNPTPPTCSTNVFYNISQSAMLYVPAGSIELYKSADAWSSFTNIEVLTIPAESITLDKNNISIKVSETATLNITVLPENTTNKEVVWTSSDESVATVENGVVTAIKVGVATITVTTTDGTNLSASCEVTVNSNGCEFVAEDIKTLHDRVVELPVYLVNDSEISAFQFDVYLPEGITIDIDEDEEYGMTLSADRATSSHTVSTFKQSNGTIRYACYSTKSAAFKGESGTLLFTIPLTIAKDIEGEFNVQIKDIILSSPSALGYNNPDMNIVVTVEKYDLGDSNGDGIINVLDVVSTVNATLGIPSENIITDAADVNGDGVINVLDIVATVNLVLNPTVNNQLNVKNIMRTQVLTETQARDNIFINDFTINASESKTIEVNMNNVDTYCAFQFDMYLPEGLTIDEEDEEFLIEATSRLTKSHMISTNKLSENVIRFVVYSNKNSNIKLNEGAIMTIPFTASAEMAAGTYQIEIKDVILSYNTGDGVNASNATTEVEVLSSTSSSISVTVDKNSDIEYYNIQGIRMENPEKGIYIKRQGDKTTKVVL